LPARQLRSLGGRMIFQVERFEPAPDTFMLQPSIESGQGK
jgi:hypothetical protein